MLLIYILIANSSLSKSEPQISSDDLDLFNPFQNRMNTHYHDAALGSWDLQVKALGYMARRQAWGSTLFLQITYAGIKKKKIKTDLPLLLQPFHVVLQLRSLAQPCCSFRSTFKSYLCTLLQCSTYMTLQVSNLPKPKASTFLSAHHSMGLIVKDLP